jgi:GNAT superfamily N-acetyltransferase
MRPNSPSATDFLEAERVYRGWNGQLRRLHGARLVTNPRFRALPEANAVLVGATEPPVPWEEIRDEAEPSFRSAGARVRRTVLFGSDAMRRLGGALLAEGQRPRTIQLVTYQGYATRVGPADVEVRLVDPFLLPVRYTLHYRVSQELYGITDAAAERASLYMSRVDAVRNLRRSFAAFVGHQFAGACDLVRLGAIATIDHIEVDPTWRGRGVATALVGRVTEEAFRDGYRGLYATSSDRNLVEGFLAGLGFEPTSELGVYDRGD